MIKNLNHLTLYQKIGKINNHFLWVFYRETDSCQSLVSVFLSAWHSLCGVCHIQPSAEMKERGNCLKSCADTKAEFLERCVKTVILEKRSKASAGFCICVFVLMFKAQNRLCSAFKEQHEGSVRGLVWMMTAVAECVGGTCTCTCTPMCCCCPIRPVYLWWSQH